jgi:hypothetical protein
MPVLTTPLVPEGPIVTLLIGVSLARAGALQAANQPVPAPVQIRALIDTGASCTCLAAGALSPLSLVPTGTTQMTTPSTGQTPVQCSQYDVSLTIAHPHLNLTIPAMPIVECQPLGGTIQGLLGRDFLSLCLFVYDGPGQRFSLAY